jgi:hypothetical protein
VLHLSLYLLDGSGWTKFVKGTLGLCGKDLNHWILLDFSRKGKFEYVKSIGTKFVVQQVVNEEHLANDIDKVQDFTAKVLGGI